MSLVFETIEAKSEAYLQNITIMCYFVKEYQLKQISTVRTFIESKAVKVFGSSRPNVSFKIATLV